MLKGFNRNMDKKICIFSSFDYYDNIPKGAVEVCHHAIIDDYIKAGYRVKVCIIPSQMGKLRMVVGNLKLLLKLFLNIITQKQIVFIYPSIPFIPTTSVVKYYFAVIVYKIAFLGKRIFNPLIILHILDYPIEQDKGLNISNVKIKSLYLFSFEKKLIEDVDYIITYSEPFSKITLERCWESKEKIIQLDFTPVRTHREMIETKVNDSVINYTNNYKTVIFYSGDLGRDYEKNKLSQLFNEIDETTCILLCGNRGDWIKERFHKHNINYLGYVDSNVHDMLASLCSFGIILYPNKGYYKVTPTTKLSVYINSLLPVVAITTEANASIFNDYEIGQCINEESVINTIIEWCKNSTYKDYLPGIKRTYDIINSLRDVNKIKSRIERRV